MQQIRSIEASSFTAFYPHFQALFGVGKRAWKRECLPRTCHNESSICLAVNYSELIDSIFETTSRSETLAAEMRLFVILSNS